MRHDIASKWVLLLLRTEQTKEMTFSKDALGTRPHVCCAFSKDESFVLNTVVPGLDVLVILEGHTMLCIFRVMQGREVGLSLTLAPTTQAFRKSLGS